MPHPQPQEDLDKMFSDVLELQDATEAVQGVFTFDDGDKIVSLAKQNGQLARGPPCVSYDELPNWVNWLDSSADVLTNILVTHCTALVEHYVG
ncbi:hypothetical protein K438DRAFT_1995076 [Mycena galopus ATCC 62051]|nr:hypothetical protein K438DRAFT_1995076 [Mycena galopus ATCC 62051]